MLGAVVTDVTYVLKLEDVMTCNQPVLPVIYSKKKSQWMWLGQDGMGASGPRQDS